MKPNKSTSQSDISSNTLPSRLSRTNIPDKKDMLFRLHKQHLQRLVDLKEEMGVSTYVEVIRKLLEES